MVIDTRSNSLPLTFTHTLMPLVAALALTGALVLTGCDSTDVMEPESEIAAVSIAPDSATIEVGERVDFSAAALTATGDTVRDASVTIDWWSTDPTVFTVEENGLATGQEPGTAYCLVEATAPQGASKTNRQLIPFTGRDSAFVTVFRGQ